jgi:maltose/moltooligosaccharide transporter
VTDTPAQTAQPARTYRVGTLVYSRRALFEVFFWLLWAAFFFQLFEGMAPFMLPLQLRWAGASDTQIGWVNSLTAFLVTCLYPVIGTRSDRHRSPLGRRRPFLYRYTPLVVLSLVLMGAAQPAGAWISRVLSSLGDPAFSAGACTIVWIALTYMLWTSLNAYVSQAYQYLFADVIPQEVIGKYFGLYRAVGAFGSIAFNRWTICWSESHLFVLNCVLGLLFWSAMAMVAWRVKEGEYPPPSPKARGGWDAARRYVRECYTHRFYLTFYCISFFFWGSLAPAGFLVFFATSAGRSGYAPTLGLSLAQFGDARSWTYLVQIPVYFLIGPLIDRFHPIRLSLLGMTLTAATYFAGFWVVRGSTSLCLWMGANQVAVAIFLGAGAALTPKLLPRANYGRLFSANQTFGYASLIGCPILSGWAFETLHDYRLVFILCGVLTALSAAALAALYLQWKQLGGDDAFQPPPVSEESPAPAP